MIKNRRAFIVGLKSTKLSSNEISFLKKYKPWGIILFSRNIKSIKQIQKLTDKIKLVFKDKKFPIIIDQEGGRVNRIDKIISFDNLTAEFFGKLYKNDKKKSYRSYKNINEQIKIYSKDLPILKNDTQNEIEYVKQTNKKKKKKFNFWKLLEND